MQYEAGSWPGRAELSRVQSIGLCCFCVLWYLKPDLISTQNVGVGDTPTKS